MAKKLSFSIALNLLTENFKKGVSTVKNGLRSIQMQVITFVAALGVGSLGLTSLITRFREVTRETSQVLTALKNVSEGSKGLADNLRFVNELAKKYGLQINMLVGSFAKFTTSATQANMPMEKQKKVFEALSRASTAFGLSAQDTNSVFLALSRMMAKGKVSSEELRRQIGERIPVAMQAMAKAAGVSMGQLEKLMRQGRLISSDIIPKFANALNEMIPNVDTDNLETSLNRLSNTFRDIVDTSGFHNKYKALIDLLNSTLQTATQNIQNIVVGIIAAIAFVVTNASSKVLKGWWVMASEMTSGQQKLNADLIKAEAARIAAFNEMEAARLKHAESKGDVRVKLAKDVAQKEILHAKTIVAEEKARVALDEVNTGKRVNIFRKGFETIKIGGAKLVASLKVMWNAFAPAIIVSALVALVGYFRNIYTESKRIKNIFAEYKKESKNVGAIQEVKMLQAQLAIMNDKTKSQKEVNEAQGALQKMLGVESKTQEDINKLVADRIKLLKAAAEADFYARKSVEYTDVNRGLINNAGLTEEQMISLVKKREEYKETGKRVPFSNEVAKIWKENTGKDLGYNVSKMIDLVDEYTQNLKVINDAESYLINATNEANKIGSNISDDPDEKELRAAEKRLEALRKLDEADRKRQIEKQKNDLDLQQKAINLMDDSFEKRIRQTLLNLKKEELAIEEEQTELLKKQQEHAKNKYVSIHGTDKGFEAYFVELKKNNFKDQDGISILPEGLRPEDIAGRVSELLSAAQDAQAKGLRDINKDLSAMLREQELMFASDLKRKLAELDDYYNEQLIKAENNAELISQIEANRKREKQEAITNDHLEKLDYSEQLENERAAGLESIGMTEMVEEKKLEITKRYLQLRIDALQELADAGDEDARKQIKMYQASLKKLDMQKPAKSLKSLADKAIFNRIQRGFEKAGDSAAEAEEKTMSLLGSISRNAGLIANIASELQSMFGGLNEELDEALSTVGNIAQGFASGGLIGGAMSLIGEGMKLFSKASEAAARHQQALKEIEEARLASQRAYNLLLLEQNLLLKEAESIFGDRQITRAANAFQIYKKSLEDLQRELQGDFTPDEAYEKHLENRASSGSFMGAFFGKQLSSYRKQVENYNKGISGLAETYIVTGHKKTGFLGWGKGKDTYSSVLDVHPEIIKANGDIDKEALQIVLNTRKMSDETRAYLENLIDLQNFAEAAQQELRSYLQSTFGSLGSDMMSSLESAIKDKGVSAWEAWGEAGSKIIEELGKQLAYELFFASKFQDLQDQMEAIYGSGKTEEDIARDAMALMGKFYQNIGSRMEIAQGFMENWQKEAAKYGFQLWKPDSSSTQDSTKGYSVSMDQDTGGAILGRITGVHESILEMKSILSAVNMDTANSLTHSIAIGDELKKHTDIFYEIQQMQVKSFRKIEDIRDNMEALSDMKTLLSDISKNTKRL